MDSNWIHINYWLAKLTISILTIIYFTCKSLLTVIIIFKLFWCDFYYFMKLQKGIINWITAEIVAKWLILFAKLGVILCGICPWSEVIYPCTCSNQKIECNGGGYNLKKLFENLSNNLTNDEKHFDAIILLK